jgi:transcriptional regulator with GAF, ATPase, and Fis domain
VQGSGLAWLGQGSNMIEHPLSDYKNARAEKSFHKGQIKSELFEGTEEELYDAYLRYRFLYEFGRMVTSQTKIDKIIDMLLDKLIELVNAERCLLLLFNTSGDTIYKIGRHLQHSEITHPEFEVSWSIINKVKETHLPVCIQDALASDSFKTMKSVLRLRILSVACIPIIHEEKCIGVLYADNRTLKGVFREDYCHLLHNFVRLIAGPLASAIHRKELENQISSIQNQLQLRSKYPSIVGTSPQIQKVIKFIDQVADTSATVIIEGESGTGKELVARAIHDNSRRKLKPFVSLNCGALTETLLESELFGHVKGAFTGATHNKKGWFETADGGTIFFDEIGEMSPGLQIKLLRVLQIGEFSPVGSSEIRTCDVRILAATNRNLQSMTKEKKFRSDLFYRLNILYIFIPPLRERREDILLLALYYLQHYGKRISKDNLTFSLAAQEVLKNYDYPGNIRELENAIQHATVMTESTEVHISDLPESLFPGPISEYGRANQNFAFSKKLVMERFERTYIESALEKSSGIIAQAARIAGIDPKNFYQKMQKYQIRAGQR